VPGESVLLVPFPEVAGVVEPWLEHSVGARPSHGIPPHVTLLFPFPPPDADVVAATRAVLAGARAFDVEFRELRGFSAPALYLAPEPEAPFVRATEELWRRFPDWPPYGGEFLPSIVPHLTVAWGAKLDEAEKDVAPRLPLHGRAREAVLLTEVEPRRWEPQARFHFRGA
jgi:2'-5' RNA ligase